MNFEKIKQDVTSFIKRCQEYFRANEPVVVKLTPNDPKDIYVYLTHPPLIVLASKWFKAYEKNKEEAFKRVVHEFLHIIGFTEFDPRLPYYHTRPYLDFFSATCYEDMKKHKYFDLDRVTQKTLRNIHNVRWLEKVVRKGSIGWEDEVYPNLLL